jgi:hypothetical protein
VLHPDVGDDVAAFMVFAAQFQAEHAADRAAGAVGREQPVSLQGVGRLRIAYGQVHTGRTGVHSNHLTLPPGLDQRIGGDGLIEIFLDVLLLEIVHRPEFFRWPVRHSEFKDLPAAVETASRGPAQCLCQERFECTEAFKDMEALAGNADRPAAVVET